MAAIYVLLRSVNDVLLGLINCDFYGTLCSHLGELFLDIPIDRRCRGEYTFVKVLNVDRPLLLILDQNLPEFLSQVADVGADFRFLGTWFLLLLNPLPALL